MKNLVYLYTILITGNLCSQTDVDVQLDETSAPDAAQICNSPITSTINIHDDVPNNSLGLYSIPFRLAEWEIPNFEYSCYLNLRGHKDVLQANMRTVYNQRNFWNHLCILRQVLPQTNAFPFFENAIDSLAYHFKVNPPADTLIDQSTLAAFRLMLSGLIEVVPLNTESLPEHWNNPAELPTLMDIYSTEVKIWNRIVVPESILCVIDLLARNYLVLIILYLTFLNLFDNAHLIREGNIMYSLLTNYNRFEQCGTRNTYENALSHADSLFIQHYY